MARADFGDPVEGSLLLVEAERGERDGARQRIGREGMAVRQGAVEVVAEEHVE